MIELLAKIQADNHAIVTVQTFGHLAPKPNNEYKGWILFTLTAFGDTCLIDFEFENIPESPWFNIDAVEHVSDFTDGLPKDKNFGVFKWEGKYKKFQNGKCKFFGKFKEINCL